MINSLYECFQHWSEGGTVWLYSDPHFSDKDLPDWPSDEEQIKMINSKVGRKDTLIILGDIGNSEYASKLRGYKVLITGNHDKGSSNYKDVFNEIYDGPLMISKKILLSHEPVDVEWAFNIHGHNHNKKYNDSHHLNCCSNIINFTPISLNKVINSGMTSDVETIHELARQKAKQSLVF